MRFFDVFTSYNYFKIEGAKEPRRKDSKTNLVPQRGRKCFRHARNTAHENGPPNKIASVYDLCSGTNLCYHQPAQSLQDLREILKPPMGRLRLSCKTPIITFKYIQENLTTGQLVTITPLHHGSITKVLILQRSFDAVWTSFECKSAKIHYPPGDQHILFQGTFEDFFYFSRLVGYVIVPLEGNVFRFPL